MSKEQPTTTSLSEYYGRFFGRLKHELRKAVWEAMIAIIAIVLALFFQFYFGWIKRDQTLPSALLNVSPYVAILLAYAARHFLRTPWLLDVERQDEVNESNNALKKLQGSLDNLTSELTRPKFSIAKVSINSYGEFDQDDRYRLSFVVDNIGSHAADEMVWRVVVVDEDPEDKNPKFEDSSMTNEIPINQPFDREFGFRAAFHQKPMIIVFCLKYKDALTKSSHGQTFFYKWVRPRFGELAPDVRHLTIGERDAAQARLEKELSGFV